MIGGLKLPCFITSFCSVLYMLSTKFPSAITPSTLLFLILAGITGLLQQIQLTLGTLLVFRRWFELDSLKEIITLFVIFLPFAVF